MELNERVNKFLKDIDRETLYDSTLTKTQIFIRESIELLKSNNIANDPLMHEYKNLAHNINICGYDIAYDEDDNEVLSIFIPYIDFSRENEWLNDNDIKKINDYMKSLVEFVHLNGVNCFHDEDLEYLTKFLLTKGKDGENVTFSVISNLYKDNHKNYGEMTLYTIDSLVNLVDDNIKLDVVLSDYGYSPLDCIIKYDLKDRLHGTYNVYMSLLPANLLVDIYNEHGAKLLEQNIRVYLNTSSKVNKGMIKTLNNPDEKEMFLAYNNGITIVAGDVKLDRYEKIIGLSNFNIVNGGQTTASLAEAAKNSNTLENIYVQAKVIKINTLDNQSTILKEITRYANSQNKVNESDLVSNELFHQQMEAKSRTIYTEYNDRWFYESKAGQYNYELSRAYEKVIFKAENPRKKKFNKKDIARVILCFEGHPHVASKGGEFALSEFEKQIKDKYYLSLVDDDSYKQYVAKLIFFQEIDDIAKNIGASTIKSRVTAYTLAKICYDLEKKINLTEIWTEQGIPDGLKLSVKKVVRLVFKQFKTYDDPNSYGKSPKCWEEFKELDTEGMYLSYDNSSYKPKGDSKIIELDDFNINDIKDWDKIIEMFKKYNIGNAHINIVKQAKQYRAINKPFTDHFQNQLYNAFAELIVRTKK